MHVSENEKLQHFIAKKDFSQQEKMKYGSGPSNVREKTEYNILKSLRSKFSCFSPLVIRVANI